MVGHLRGNSSHAHMHIRMYEFVCEYIYTYVHIYTYAAGTISERFGIGYTHTCAHIYIRV